MVSLARASKRRFRFRGFNVVGPSSDPRCCSRVGMELGMPSAGNAAVVNKTRCLLAGGGRVGGDKRRCLSFWSLLVLGGVW